MWRRVVAATSSLCCCVVLLAALLAMDSARGADLPPPAAPPPPPPPVVPVYKAPDLVWSSFYVGGAFTWVHHTGYVPNTLPRASAEEYTVGFKVFGGYRFTPQNSVEIEYHHLGGVRIDDMPVETHEHSWAITGSFVHESPPFTQWIGPGPWYDYLHAFVRLGLAYKHVEQDSVIGTFNEGILSGVIGAGIVAHFTDQWFGRLEYEYISTAIGGPPQPVPGFRGLYQVTIGGTYRTIT